MKTGTRSRPGSTRAVALGVALVLFTQGCTFSLQASSATSLASSAQSSAQSSTNVSVNSSAQSSATLGNGASSLIIAGAALLVGAAFAVGFAIYGSTRTQSSPPPAPPPPASPRPAAPAPAPAPGAPPPPPPPPPVPGTPAPTNDPNAPLSPPPLVPAAYLDTARQWLAANERQLRQDLALGAGPALDDLAAAAGIRPEHARDFRAVLRRHRADLLARLPASPTVDSAKDFFERVGALTWAEPVLQADARAFLDSLGGS